MYTHIHIYINLYNFNNNICIYNIYIYILATCISQHKLSFQTLKFRRACAHTQTQTHILTQHTHKQNLSHRHSRVFSTYIIIYNNNNYNHNNNAAVANCYNDRYAEHFLFFFIN